MSKVKGKKESLKLGKLPKLKMKWDAKKGIGTLYTSFDPNPSMLSPHLSPKSKSKSKSEEEYKLIFYQRDKIPVITSDITKPSDLFFISASIPLPILVNLVKNENDTYVQYREVVLNRDNILDVIQAHENYYKERVSEIVDNFLKTNDVELNDVILHRLLNSIDVLLLHIYELDELLMKIDNAASSEHIGWLLTIFITLSIYMSNNLYRIHYELDAGGRLDALSILYLKISMLLLKRDKIPLYNDDLKSSVNTLKHEINTWQTKTNSKSPSVSSTTKANMLAAEIQSLAPTLLLESNLKDVSQDRKYNVIRGEVLGERGVEDPAYGTLDLFLSNKFPICVRGEITIKVLCIENKFDKYNMEVREYAKCPQNMRFEYWKYYIDIYNNNSSIAGHANLILVDKKLKTLEHFEPHGEQMDLSSILDSSQMNIVNSVITDAATIAGKNKYGPEFTMLTRDLTSARWCGSKCLQDFEDKYDPDMIRTGYCITWVFVYLFYRLTYPDVDRQSLVRYIMGAFQRKDVHILTFSRYLTSRMNEILFKLRLLKEKTYDVKTQTFAFYSDKMKKIAKKAIKSTYQKHVADHIDNPTLGDTYWLS
jgi:hypothetical protein